MSPISNLVAIASAIGVVAASALNPTVLPIRSSPIINRTIQLDIPSSPPEGRQVIDAAFQSYSIEFSYMQDYAGNNTNPNHFSSKLLRNLASISGAYPIIRAGGSTQNRAIWVQNQTLAIIPTFSPPGADQPSALTIGPAWLEAFQQFPRGTRYIFGLSFQDGAAGLNQTLLEAIPSFATLGESLYAWEIGNEVDGFPGGRRPANWTVQDYVDQWLQYADAISEDAIGPALDPKVEPLFQAGAFEAPRHLNNASYFTAQSVIEDGIAETGKVKTVSDHDYMGSNCADNKVLVTLAKNLLDHSHMTSLMWYHEFLSNFSVSHGVPYVIGETNSISCQGLAGVSDVFGAALWAIDYVLYVATLHVSRIYFHMGTPYRYSAWQPIAINSTLPYVKSLYYGNLFTSTALAGGNKQVALLVNETHLTSYGIYEACEGSAKLTGVAVINLNEWNSTQPAAQRPYTEVDLPEEFEGRGLEVRRLTAPGAELTGNITLAGRYVSNDGDIEGREVVERVVGLKVLVGASEAVLITIQ